jgi:hypothetical protein
MTMPDTTPDDTELAVEFDALAKRAGLSIPEDRKPALLKGYKDLKRLTAMLRQPRTAADETAGAYSILSITRSL